MATLLYFGRVCFLRPNVNVLQCSLKSAQRVSLGKQFHTLTTHKGSKCIHRSQTHSQTGLLGLVKRHLRQATRKEGRGQSLTPVEAIEGGVQRGPRNLLKPFAFALLVSGGCLCGSALWQYEYLRSIIQKRQGANLQTHTFYGKAGGFRAQINQYWNQLSSGEKTVATIIGLNAVVFLLWKAPALQRGMLKYFTSSPYSGAPCTSMLLSNFSHFSFMHIFCNMYVLWSFTPSIINLLGREQFVGFYVAAGVWSGFASYVFRVARFSLTPSLGASGAIMAVLGAVCTFYPDTQLSIAFIGDIIPHSFSAGNAVKGLILIDTLGIILRWRFFDHAAHLGGMLFGIWYANYGHKIIWKRREPIMKWYHNQRGKP